MDNTVIDLEQRRRQNEDDAADYATCPCGEAWFELRSPHGPAPHGAVCLAQDGHTITGYTGRPHCVSCGKPYTPRR